MVSILAGDLEDRPPFFSRNLMMPFGERFLGSVEPWVGIGLDFWALAGRMIPLCWGLVGDHCRGLGDSQGGVAAASGVDRDASKNDHTKLF